MARPERNNVDYFPHPVTHGRKMHYLDTHYKNDGYVVWFRTLEELGKADFHYLDLMDETQVMYLSSRCNVSEELYLEIIEVLVKFGDFDEALWEVHRIIWNQKFFDSIQDAYKRRVNECVTKSKLIHKLGFTYTETSKTPTEIPKPSKKDDSKPQRIVKDNKVKDNKGKGAPSSRAISYKDFYSEEFKKTKNHSYRTKYFHIVKYIMNMDQNIINESGEHILKLKKQLSFEEFIKLYDFCQKRATTIKEMLNSWLNNPQYSKGRISVYAVLRNWANKAEIRGTNLVSTPDRPLAKTSIGQEK